MNLPAKKNEAYQPTVVEQSANIITHAVRNLLLSCTELLKRF